jgi:DNA-binding SARP family transcriptional activator
VVECEAAARSRGWCSALIGVLGPVLLDASDVTTTPSSAAQRRLLAALAVASPLPVRSERLADVLGLTPSGLRTAITRLRRALGEHVLVSTPGGYGLATEVDALAFGRLLDETPGDRAAAVRAALALWRGPALEEFAHEEWAAGVAARLHELHAAAVEEHAEGLLGRGQWCEAIALLRAHIARHPLRDRPRGQLMRSLAGDGRQAEALRALHDYWRLLDAEVSTAPSNEVRELGERIAAGWSPSAGAGPAVPAGSLRRAPLPAPLRVARHGAFVGRGPLVEELCASRRCGAWHTLIASGEPGTGKSRLLAELAVRIRRPGQAVALARGDADFLDAVVALIGRCGPVLLVLDDLHAFDVASLAILRRVVTAGVPGLVVLGAYRDTGLPADHPVHAMLAELRYEEGVRRLALDGRVELSRMVPAPSLR